MPQVYFVTQYSVDDLKDHFKKNKLGSNMESESQVLDYAITHFIDRAVELKFYGLFKKHFLITPATTSNNSFQN